MNDYLLVLLGEPQAGKSTAAEIISNMTGWERGTCSTIIYNILAKLDGLPPGNWHDVIPEDQHAQTRERLIKLGNAISDEVPFVYPVALLNKGCRVIDGVRRKTELSALSEYCYNRGVDMVPIWIGRKDRPPIQDNNELSEEDAALVIQANDLSDLTTRVEDMINNLLNQQ